MEFKTETMEKSSEQEAPNRSSKWPECFVDLWILTEIFSVQFNLQCTVYTVLSSSTAGAYPGEVKWVNFHPPPLFLSPLLSFFSYPSNIWNNIWFLWPYYKNSPPPPPPNFKILDLPLHWLAFPEHLRKNLRVVGDFRDRRRMGAYYER